MEHHGSLKGRRAVAGTCIRPEASLKSRLDLRWVKGSWVKISEDITGLNLCKS